MKTSVWLIIKLVLLGPSGLTVNVGIVLPFAVDPGMQPNEVVGKLALGQLLSITDLAFTLPNPSFRKCLFFFTVVLQYVSLTENNDSHINNTCLCKGKAKTFLHRQILLTARRKKNWKMKGERRDSLAQRWVSVEWRFCLDWEKGEAEMTHKITGLRSESNTTQLLFK